MKLSLAQYRAESVMVTLQIDKSVYPRTRLLFPQEIKDTVDGQRILEKKGSAAVSLSVSVSTCAPVRAIRRMRESQKRHQKKNVFACFCLDCDETMHIRSASLFPRFIVTVETCMKLQLKKVYIC